MPTVSVIIPSYNHEKYIGECIQSVLNQTYRDFEIVITDDGSTDRTVEIVENFDDPRIKLFKHFENKGAPVALNNCIRHASGKYIAPIGSDDAWYPEKLELQVRYLDEHPDIAVVFSKVDWVDELGSLIADEQNSYKDVFDAQNRTRFEWLRYFFKEGNCLNMPSSLIRRKCFTEIGLLNPVLAGLHDFELWIRICLMYDIMILDKKFVRYRWMSDNSNASGDTRPTHIRNRFEYKQVLDHYLKITKMDELLAIFPDAPKYGKVTTDIVPYFLGRIAIASGLDFKVLWGQETIFTLLQDEKAAQIVEENCNFAYLDLINLIRENDIYKIFILHDQVAENERQLAEKVSYINSLNILVDSIYQATPWKITRPIRGAKTFALTMLTSVRSVARQIGALIYHAVPASPEKKLRLKKTLFRHFGSILVPQSDKAPPFLAISETNDMAQLDASSFGNPILPPIKIVDRRKISVIITSFNHERYIKQCLESILDQKGNFNLEIILGDDCSTDKTSEIIQQYYETYPDTIKMMPQEPNLGITKNLKRCLDACSGVYIAICEGDDYWTDNYKLQKQQEFLDKHRECSMCFSAIVLYNEDTNQFVPHQGQLSLKKQFLTTEDLIKINYIGNFSCCMYRTNSVRMLDDRLFDIYTVDWMFNMAMGELGEIGFLSEPMSVYRIRSGGAWSGKSRLDQLYEQSFYIDLYNKYFEYKYDPAFSRLKRELDVEINRL
jgi:glycosyltransferase involved in cell wall biosynthesis